MIKDKAHNVKPISHASTKGDIAATGSSGTVGVITLSVIGGIWTVPPFEMGELCVREVLSCTVDALPRSLTTVKMLNGE